MNPNDLALHSVLSPTMGRVRPGPKSPLLSPVTGGKRSPGLRPVPKCPSVNRGASK